MARISLAASISDPNTNTRRSALQLSPEHRLGEYKVGFLHAPELIFLFVLLLFLFGSVALVWLFGMAIGRGIARGQKK